MSETSEPHDLQRFLDAQSGSIPGCSDYEEALAEITNGKKTTHWMWYIFPQIRGLGNSELARRFAIRDLDEARSYLTHPVLGTRIRECSDLVYKAKTLSALEIFGRTDSMKLRSSMTLFEHAADDRSVFAQVLEKYFDGESDPRTLQILEDNT